ncbi:glycoside hydrolase family 35 protein [Rickenella mellea]|uniref:Beta-galactosidase n=1 Tax=Rickenella mellea TaxID=50990 RepID=A0A4Y7Q9A3_9AGAM|nr:glycoside hydrolase family 35 protein [Rickenella mellea]
MLAFCLVALLGALSCLQSSQAVLDARYQTDHSLSRRNSTGLTNVVTWDPHSLSIFGQRIFIYSAEFHPWRLPNPNLWADIFQKLKANGYNTVSFYVHWGTHFPTPTTNGGQGDFTPGTYRDIQNFITQAKNAGIWLIARPGPYINGEASGGGFPGWVGNVAGTLRSTNTAYTAAWTPYMTAISKLISQNQVTNGGPIILVQAENEFSPGSTHSPYMQAIEDLYRQEGIVIPITFNDQHSGQNGYFSPDLGGQGAVNIYCADSYPQGSTHWNQVSSSYLPFHQAVAPSNPLCLGEFGGGYLLNWGGNTMGGTGYERYETDITGPASENVFHKDVFAQTTALLNIYMVFGGTNWGQTAEPTVYTSYDYGGGINENRVATPKMNEIRQQGAFLRVARDLLAANVINTGTTYTSSNLLHTAELRNPQTNAGFYFVRHNDSTSTAITTSTLTVSTSSGTMTIPKSGSLTLGSSSLGREFKILPADFVFGVSKTNMLYTTAEVYSWTTLDRSDFIVLYAPAGQTGETAFKLASSAITVTKDSGVTSTVSGNLVTLNYNLNGVQHATITAGTATIQVIMVDKATAYNWHFPVIAGTGTFANYFSVGTNQSVIVAGPYIVRSASIAGNTLSLNGDLNGTTTLEFFAPSAVTNLIWNGAVQRIQATAHKSFTVTLPGASAVALPKLGGWKVLGSLPETDPAFDDSSFITATQTTTNYTNLPPLAGKNVLFSQQYGIYGGQLIWRGHFTATGSETSFALTVTGGVAFGYSVWFNGHFLGSRPGNVSQSESSDTWNIPSGTLSVGKDNVLTVFQAHAYSSIVETSTNGGKEPRGIRGYAINGGSTTFSSWKLGAQLGGAANAPDTFRGYLNEGGMFFERIGAHLPGFDDSAWQAASSLSVAGAGVNFFRTTFSLNLPANAADVPIRLSFTPSAITSNYRAIIYLNGWNLGKFINNIGPQTIFVLHCLSFNAARILRRSSPNTLGVALWSLDGSGASIAGLSLISDGAFTSSFKFSDWTAAPDYAAQATKRTKAAYYKPM